MADPTTVAVTLDIDSYLVRFTGYDRNGEERVEPMTLEDVIIQEAARQLVERAINGVLKDEWSGLRKVIGDVRDQVVVDRVRSMVDDALSAAFEPTNEFGESTGQRTSLRQVITESAKKQLIPTEDRYGRKKSAIKEVIDAACSSTIKAELQKELNEAKAQVSAAVKNQGAKVLEETITRLAKV